MRDDAGSGANGLGDGGAAAIEGVGTFAGAVAICRVEDAAMPTKLVLLSGMLLPLLLLVSTSVSAALVMKMLSLPLVLASVLASGCGRSCRSCRSCRCYRHRRSYCV